MNAHIKSFAGLAAAIQQNEEGSVTLRNEEFVTILTPNKQPSEASQKAYEQAWNAWYESAHLIDNRNGGNMVIARLAFPYQQIANNSYAALYGRNGKPDTPDMYSAKQGLEHRASLAEKALAKYQDDQGFMDQGQADAAGNDQFVLDTQARLEEAQAWYDFCLAKFNADVERYELLTGEKFVYKPYVTPAVSKDSNDRAAQLRSRTLASLKNRAVAAA